MKKTVKKTGETGKAPQLTKAEKQLLAASNAILDATPPLTDQGDWGIDSFTQSLVEQWASASLVTKQMRARLERDCSCLVGAILPLYIGRWLADQTPPKNPRLVASKAMCHFVLQPTKLSVVVPRPLKTVEAAFRRVGISAQRARGFAKYVQIQKDQDFVASLPDMLNHEVVSIRTAAASLHAAIQANESWKLLLVQESRFVVADPVGFVQKLPRRAKSADEMQRVLRVIQPTMYPCQPVHTAPEAAVDARRVWEKEVQRVFYSPDNRYKVVAQNREVLIFAQSQGEWQFLGVVKRSSSEAARTFAAEIAADAKKLPASILTFGN